MMARGTTIGRNMRPNGNRSQVSLWTVTTRALIENTMTFVLVCALWGLLIAIALQTALS